MPKDENSDENADGNPESDGDAAVKVSKSAVRRALAFYCNRQEYLSAMAEDDSVRINLDGSESERVSDEHRKRARQMLSSRRRDKRKPKKPATANSKT